MFSAKVRVRKKIAILSVVHASCHPLYEKNACDGQSAEEQSAALDAALEAAEVAKGERTTETGGAAVEGSRICDELTELRVLAGGDGKDGAESSSHCIK